jgi:hypothetical protein
MEAGNIVYITASNPLLASCSSPPINVSQGNASNSNDNSETSLVCKSQTKCRTDEHLQFAQEQLQATLNYSLN